MTDKDATPQVDDELLEDGDESVTEIEMGSIMLRPDGYHWQSPDGKSEFGPFDTVEAALAEQETATLARRVRICRPLANFVNRVRHPR